LGDALSVLVFGQHLLSCFAIRFGRFIHRLFSKCKI
jgi:hypothetical protein